MPDDGVIAEGDRRRGGVGGVPGERDATGAGELAERVDVQRGGAGGPAGRGVDAGESAERVPPVAAPVVRALFGDPPAGLVVAVVAGSVRAGRRAELPRRVVGVVASPVGAGLGDEAAGGVVGEQSLTGRVGGAHELPGGVVAEQAGAAVGVGGDDAAVLVAGQPGQPGRLVWLPAPLVAGEAAVGVAPAGRHARAGQGEQPPVRVALQVQPPGHRVLQADDAARAVAAVGGHGAVGVGQPGAQAVGVVGPADGGVAGPALDEPPRRVPAQLDRLAPAAGRLGDAGRPGEHVPLDPDRHAHAVGRGGAAVAVTALGRPEGSWVTRRRAPVGSCCSRTRPASSRR